MDFSTKPLRTTFRESIQKICPPWLQGYWGSRLMYSIGIQLDGTSTLLQEGVLARMPGYGTPDALQYNGNDRQILRGFEESDESYTQRIQSALDTWKIAGNAQSIIKQLVGYVSPAVPKFSYVVNGVDETSTVIADWVTVENDSVSFHRANPSNWNWDGTYVPNRFWIIVYPGVWDLRVWGDGRRYGDGSTWGTTASAAQVRDVRALVSKWKCAGTEELYTIIASGPAQFSPSAVPGAPMPNGTWGNPVNRDSAAAYWLGTLN